jgi:hypothetical protein
MKRTQSSIPMPPHEISGREVTLYWDERVIERETEAGTETVYDYAYCVAPRGNNYADLVGRIIRSQYSVDQEFAMINEAINGSKEKHAEFLKFRDVARKIARDYAEALMLAQRPPQPFPSWTWQEGGWTAPKKRPAKGNYGWDEEKLKWVKVEVTE